MTAQLPSRERLETLTRAIECESYDEEEIVSWVNSDEILSMARFALAAHEQEPVAYMYRDNLHTDARFSLEPRFGNWSPEDISEYEISETPLYDHPAPSIPTVPVGDRGDFETFVRSIPNGCNELAVDAAGFYKNSKVHYMFAAWNACRTAMQPNVTLTYEGDNHTEHNLGMVNHIGEDTGTDEVKPVTAATVPAGYVLVPVEPTPEMLTASYVFAHIDNTADSWKAMLAAAPKAPDGWIPVSERYPDVGDIVLTAIDGCTNVGEMERSGENYRYFTSVVSGRELPATHWQPLPDAPKMTP